MHVTHQQSDVSCMPRTSRVTSVACDAPAKWRQLHATQMQSDVSCMWRTSRVESVACDAPAEWRQLHVTHQPVLRDAPAYVTACTSRLHCPCDGMYLVTHLPVWRPVPRDAPASVTACTSWRTCSCYSISLVTDITGTVGASTSHAAHLTFHQRHRPHITHVPAASTVTAAGSSYNGNTLSNFVLNTFFVATVQLTGSVTMFPS